MTESAIFPHGQRLRIVAGIAMLLGVIAAAVLMCQWQSVRDRQDRLVSIVEMARQTALDLQQAVAAGEISRSDAQASVLGSLHELTAALGPDLYLFVLDYQTNRLIHHPRMPDAVGQDISMLHDVNGLPVILRLGEIARTQESGWLTYNLSGYGGLMPGQKLTYVSAFRPWHWSFNAGLPMSDFDQASNRAFTIALACLALGLLIMLALPFRQLIARGSRWPDADCGRQVSSLLDNVGDAGSFGGRAQIVVDTEGRVLDCLPCPGSLGASGNCRLTAPTLTRLFEDMPDGDRIVAHLLEVGRNAPEGARFWNAGSLRTKAFGDERLVNVSANVLSILPARRFAITILDVTDQARRAEDLEWRATRDLPTGLPNRALIQDLANHQFQKAARSGGDLTLLWVQFGRLSEVGHHLGLEEIDQVVAAIADRLRDTLRSADLVGRMEADAFLIVLTNTLSPEKAAQTAERLLSAFAHPIAIRGEGQEPGQLRCLPTIGIAPYDDTVGTVSSLICRARSTAHAVEETDSPGGYGFYHPDMTHKARAQLKLESDLRDAIHDGTLALHYQPKVTLDGLRLCGFEALVRWNHPDRGAISPAEFVPLAEETGLIIDLGRWVLNEACRQVASWTAAGLPVVPIAVNVSAKQLVQGASAGLLEIIRDHDVPPGLIEIEITESAMARDLDTVAEELRHLRDAGLSIAIDDFGTGYSALCYLKRLPATTLKIDRAFVQEVPHQPDDCDIVRLIIAIGQALNLQVVAEGIETVEQADTLRDYGATVIQGFLVSKPLSAPRATQLLEAPPGPMRCLDDLGVAA